MKKEEELGRYNATFHTYEWICKKCGKRCGVREEVVFFNLDKIFHPWKYYQCPCENENIKVNNY